MKTKNSTTAKKNTKNTKNTKPAAKAPAKPQSEKAKLVAAIYEIDPNTSATENQSREELRKMLAAAKARATKTPAKKKAKSAPVVTPEPTPAPVAPVATPEPVVIPKDLPPPSTIELKRDGETGKRYVSKTAPDSKYHLRDRSEAPKPVSIVRRVCAENPGLPRKEIIVLCLGLGVNKNTAATQYSLYQAFLKKEAEKASQGEDEGGEE